MVTRLALTFAALCILIIGGQALADGADMTRALALLLLAAPADGGSHC